MNYYSITSWYIQSIPFLLSISIPTHLYMATVDLYEENEYSEKPLPKMYICKKITKSICYGIVNAVFFPLVFNYSIIKFYMLQNEFKR